MADSTANRSVQTKGGIDSEKPDRESIHVRIARLTAPVLFALSVIFLVCQAVLIVLWVDVPSLREKTMEVADTVAQESELSDRPLTAVTASGGEVLVMGPSTSGERTLERFALATMFVIWPIVIAETAYHWIIRPKTWAMRWFHFFGVLFCLSPSLRMCARSVEMNGRLWLPGMSWRRPDRRLRRRLEQHFSIPMIGIALLILPVLLVEFLLKDQVAKYASLRLALHVGTGVIWFAFAAEFILMASIAEKKLDYLRKNWVDLAIIALPFFSFLRSMQAVRGSRLAKLAKIPQLTKLARAYRLRGTVLKAFRALVLLDVSARLIHTTPEKRLARLRVELTATQREARLIRLMIARLEREIAETVESGEVGHENEPE
ncbi:potassium channel protein [Neorhodopirellula pilleata]|uniref:Potassium channel protein n=1 Tax=Neorhodopirellula pilleata TaxID=2714738 RepID=A0A5C6A7T6_9BACT|nr:potassium channel protein [Neorhodopirellula pilleata]TWT95141.1 hypothetical protein Pla100_37250 [Neorhodopirellula pilleata]